MATGTVRTRCACAFVGRKSCACLGPETAENTWLSVGTGNAAI